ncbi:PqqD family protein [Demequina sp. NBRC 110056]|uniref:PqqD family protein n=1 Tax=Demequina sp. NBRC 110056 TaxID=1570345 RepID=UPI00135635BC|nr:PqqD family protein [Demequina sp. NBRC 110056]
MTNPATASALHRAQGLAHVDHDDYTVVLNLPRLQEQQSPYIFDGTSFAIWNLIDGTRTQEQIAAELADTYGAPRDQVAPDVDAFIAQLLDLGLVTHDPPSDGSVTPVK